MRQAARCATGGCVRVVGCVQVAHYLVRLEPFTRLALSLQDGRFDHPDRLFLDVGATWQGCMEDMADVKELVSPTRDPTLHPKRARCAPCAPVPASGGSPAELPAPCPTCLPLAVCSVVRPVADPRVVLPPRDVLQRQPPGAGVHAAGPQNRCGASPHASVPIPAPRLGATPWPP